MLVSRRARELTRRLEELPGLLAAGSEAEAGAGTLAEGRTAGSTEAVSAGAVAVTLAVDGHAMLVIDEEDDTRE